MTVAAPAPHAPRDRYDADRIRTDIDAGYTRDRDAGKHASRRSHKRDNRYEGNADVLRMEVQFAVRRTYAKRPFNISTPALNAAAFENRTRNISASRDICDIAEDRATAAARATTASADFDGGSAVDDCAIAELPGDVVAPAVSAAIVCKGAAVTLSYGNVDDAC